MRRAALAIALLAGQSCNNPPVAQLVISLSVCSCAPGDVSIDVDNIVVFPAVRCPFSGQPVAVTPGPHVIRATSGDVSWSRDVDAAENTTTRVELGCPRS
jgi:hypothetical protein